VMHLHGICFFSLVGPNRVSLEAKLHLKLKASSRSLVLGSRSRSWPVPRQDDAKECHPLPLTVQDHEPVHR
jgi:hypothetical protein